MTDSTLIHQSRPGPKPRYPWLTMQVGETYHIPVASPILPRAVTDAVRRRNADNLQRGRPERFSAPNERVRHPATGEPCYRVVRIV